MKSLSPSKHLRFIKRSVVVSAVLAVCALNAADTPGTSATTQGSGASRLSGNSETANMAGHSSRSSDAKSFLREAVEGNLAEVALAEVAERKSQNADVKEFAKMIKQDHQQANRQLESIAQAHGISINQPLNSKHQKKLDRFQAMSGTEFDKEYATDMLKDHQKDISKYEEAARDIKETDVQQYAQNTLPKLRQHLQHAAHTAQSVGVSQSTITSIMKKTPDAMGGSEDTMEKSSGSGDSQK